MKNPTTQDIQGLVQYPKNTNPADQNARVVVKVVKVDAIVLGY